MSDEVTEEILHYPRNSMIHLIFVQPMGATLPDPAIVMADAIIKASYSAK